MTKIFTPSHSWKAPTVTKSTGTTEKRSSGIKRNTEWDNREIHRDYSLLQRNSWSDHTENDNREKLHQRSLLASREWQSHMRFLRGDCSSAQSCPKWRSSLTILYAEKTTCYNESSLVTKQRRLIMTHVRAKAIRAPTTTMKSRMFHISRK